MRILAAWADATKRARSSGTVLVTTSILVATVTAGSVGLFTWAGLGVTSVTGTCSTTVLRAVKPAASTLAALRFSESITLFASTSGGMKDRFFDPGRTT